MNPETKRKADKHLCKKGVVGHAHAKKVIKGESTDEHAVVFFVDKKRPLSRINRRDRVPKTCDGLKTDVVELGKVQVCRAMEWSEEDDSYRSEVDSTLLVSVSGDRMSAGTGNIIKKFCVPKWVPYKNPLVNGIYNLVVRTGNFNLISYVIDKLDEKNIHIDSEGGLVAQDGLIWFGVSNNHVLVNQVDMSMSEFTHLPVYNPGLLDRYYADSHVIGEVVDFIELKSDGINEADYALFKVDEDIELEDKGNYQGDLSLGTEDVWKIGRTTGYTTGKKLYSDATIVVDGYGDEGKSLVFSGQDVYTKMLTKGDSGSLILDGFNNEVGLAFATSDKASFATPWRVIEDRAMKFIEENFSR